MEPSSAALPCRCPRQGLSAVLWGDNSGAGQWKGCREQAQDKHCSCPTAAAPAAEDAAGFTGLRVERTEQTRDPGRGNPIFRKKPKGTQHQLHGMAKRSERLQDSPASRTGNPRHGSFPEQ